MNAVMGHVAPAKTDYSRTVQYVDRSEKVVLEFFGGIINSINSLSFNSGGK